MTELTYAPIGATRTGDLPPGYRHLRYRTLLGSGEELYRRAGEAIVTFAMHRSLPAKITTSGPRAEPGVRLTVGAGPLRVPCEVVWASNEGFGYGTLPGHQAAGEEAFAVVRDAQDRVWFTVTAYSRPARLPMILAGPLAVVFQRAYARLCGRALKRICTVNP
nr:DUF1990 domain-containing protein [uncultured Actinoplanes sp.]